MDIMAMGIESLEVAMHVGSNAVSALDNLVHLSAKGSEITCEICRCAWM